MHDTKLITWQRLRSHHPRAWAKISSRQRSYIDEFVFKENPNRIIYAIYGGDHLATWDGKAWLRVGFNAEEEDRKR